MTESPKRRPAQRKKRKRSPEARPGSVRRPAEEPADTSPRDRLGNLIDEYRFTLAGAIVVCGVLGVVGAVALWWGWSQQPRTVVAWAAIGVGGFVLLMALLLFGNSLLNVGRGLEIRKQGIRYTERGETTEFFWKEIVAVETDRLDSTYMGVATKHTRSDDAVSLSGPLTKTEFTVTILADDGRMITLPQAFMRTVGDPKKLISKLKLRAGI